ncbi:MAG TPA: hypothetical protein VFA15_02630 [Nitrososphaera sp.]|nr:hypothetical protein [Nitrososphaera sp.]
MSDSKHYLDRPDLKVALEQSETKPKSEKLKSFEGVPLKKSDLKILEWLKKIGRKN